MPASDFVKTTYPELEARIDAAYDRFTDLVGRVAQDQPVGPTWTARDVVAHVLCVVNRYTAFEPGRLAETPRGVDAINQRELEEHVGRSTTELLEVLADEMARFRGQWGAGSGLPLDLALPFHGSTTIDLQSGLTNLIGEYLLHGRDVAEASTVPWAIDDRDGALLCGFATQLLPSYVRAANDVRLSLRFDLDGVAPWVLDVDGPTATSRPADTADEPDVQLCGPATPAALLFYSRLDLGEAHRLGLRVVGGAHPDDADRITELFEAP